MGSAMPRGRLRPLAAAFWIWIPLAAAAWYFFAPPQIGGRTTYLITQGTSMEPRIHQGDLVLVRKAASYRVGDIVAYRLTPRTLVLHRITGIAANVGAAGAPHWIMKGDNNAWPDSKQPATQDIVGKLWIQLPSAGSTWLRLGKPLALALFLLMAGIMLQTTTANTSQEPGPRAKSRLRKPAGSWTGSSAVSVWFQALVVVGLLAPVFLVLCAIAFAQPAQQLGSVAVTYDQNGVFGYSAAAPPGIYDQQEVTTGEPVYLRLVHDLTVRFTYHFKAQAPHDLHGTYQIFLTIAGENGWRRTAALAPATAFSGDTVRMSGKVDLTQVQALLAAVAQQTGVQGQLSTLTLQPVVKTLGTLSGAKLSERFSPSLRFRMAPLELVLDKGANDNGGPLHPAQSGLVKLARREASRISMLGLSLQVSLIRVIAVAGLTLSAIAAAVLGLLLHGVLHGDESARIRARYGASLIEIHTNDPAAAPASTVIDACSIDDLAKVARQRGQLLLHSCDSAGHRYSVVDGCVIYQYRVVKPARDDDEKAV